MKPIRVLKSIAHWKKAATASNTAATGKTVTAEHLPFN